MNSGYVLLGIVVLLLAIACGLLSAAAWPIWKLASRGPWQINAFMFFLLVWGAMVGGFAGATLSASRWGLIGAMLVAPVAACAGVFLAMLVFASARMHGIVNGLTGHAVPKPKLWWLRPFHSLPRRPKIVTRVLGVLLSIAAFAVGIASDAPGMSLALIILGWRFASTVADAMHDVRGYFKHQSQTEDNTDRPALTALPHARNSGLRARIARAVWGYEHHPR